MQLHHSLQRDPEKKKHLVKFMGKILDSKSAEVVPIETNCFEIDRAGTRQKNNTEHGINIRKGERKE